MTKPKTIEVEVEEVSPKTLYLRQHLGDGSLGKTKFDASFILPTMGLLVGVGEKRYLVHSQKLIEQIVILHEKLCHKTSKNIANQN